MDTSETYIKMCERAKEIQKIAPVLKRSDLGDNIYCLCHLWHHVDDIFFEYKGLFIWLPRQDQLQEMVLKVSERILLLTDLIYNFRRFAEGYDYEDIQNINLPNSGHFTSMEQLWLAFVMKEKYNKVWNGSDWVKPPAV